MFLREYSTIVLPTHCIFKPWLYIYGEDVTYVMGVARIMNMCTHNARGTDLRSFSETGREWIFLNL